MPDRYQNKAKNRIGPASFREVEIQRSREVSQFLQAKGNYGNQTEHDQSDSGLFDLEDHFFPFGKTLLDPESFEGSFFPNPENKECQSGYRIISDHVHTKLE